MLEPSTESTDTANVDVPLFLFASGFGFGVALTLLFLAVVGSALGDGQVTLTAVVGSELGGTLLGGAVFALIVGAGLFVLSFRSNREYLVGLLGREID